MQITSTSNPAPARASASRRTMGSYQSFWRTMHARRRPTRPEGIIGRCPRLQATTDPSAQSRRHWPGELAPGPFQGTPEVSRPEDAALDLTVMRWIVIAEQLDRLSTPFLLVPGETVVARRHLAEVVPAEAGRACFTDRHPVDGVVRPELKLGRVPAVAEVADRAPAGQEDRPGQQLCPAARRPLRQQQAHAPLRREQLPHQLEHAKRPGRGCVGTHRLQVEPVPVPDIVQRRRLAHHDSRAPGLADGAHDRGLVLRAAEGEFPGISRQVQHVRGGPGDAAEPAGLPVEGGTQDLELQPAGRGAVDPVDGGRQQRPDAARVGGHRPGHRGVGQGGQMPAGQQAVLLEQRQHTQQAPGVIGAAQRGWLVPEGVLDDLEPGRMMKWQRVLASGDQVSPAGILRAKVYDPPRQRRWAGRKRRARGGGPGHLAPRTAAPLMAPGTAGTRGPPGSLITRATIVWPAMTRSPTWMASLISARAGRMRSTWEPRRMAPTRPPSGSSWPGTAKVTIRRTRREAICTSATCRSPFSMSVVTRSLLSRLAGSRSEPNVPGARITHPTRPAMGARLTWTSARFMEMPTATAPPRPRSVPASSRSSCGRPCFSATGSRASAKGRT